MRNNELTIKKPSLPGSTITLISAGILFVAVLFFMSQNAAMADEVVVYKSPSCGCCSKWVEHLEDNGFTVKSQNQRNMSSIKKAMGVPGHLQSCHTAKVGDYVIEGHVPADLVIRLLQEKPAVRGLTVPGMPMGSPGMEGPRKDEYNVLTFQADGKTAVYANR